MPKVSVIIPCHNLGQYLDETVASVLAQTYTDYEIVIVDDGSTDQFTRQLLGTYRRPRTTVIRTGNQGVAAARNTAIAAASGEYVLPLDADDLIAPAYLAKGVPVLDADPAVGIVTCLIEFFGAHSYRPVIPPFSLDAMTVRNDLPCTSLFRRRDWERVGGYNTRMERGWEDWDFWLALLELGGAVHRLQEVLFRYRIREGSRERSIAADQRVDLFLQLYANHPDLYHRHMGGVFQEVCAYHELLCSRRYRRLTLLENPGELAKSLGRRLGRLLRGPWGGGK